MSGLASERAAREVASTDELLRRIQRVSDDTALVPATRWLDEDFERRYALHTAGQRQRWCDRQWIEYADQCACEGTWDRPAAEVDALDHTACLIFDGASWPTPHPHDDITDYAALRAEQDRARRPVPQVTIDPETLVAFQRAFTDTLDVVRAAFADLADTFRAVGETVTKAFTPPLGRADYVLVPPGAHADVRERALRAVQGRGGWPGSEPAGALRAPRSAGVPPRPTGARPGRRRGRRGRV